MTTKNKSKRTRTSAVASAHASTNNLTKHSTWSGVDIYVDKDGTFYAEAADDIEIHNDRLSSVRESIDRALKPTSKKAKLALPVIVITDEAAIPTTLTGVSRSNREMEFSPTIKGRRHGMKVIADTPANRALAKSYLDAQRVLDTAADLVGKRAIEVSGYGRIEIEAYQRIVDSLSTAHARSAKEKGK